MKCMQSKVVNIPLHNDDLIRNVNVLPRNIDQSGLIQIRVKRKLEYKTNMYEGFIRPEIVTQALQYFIMLKNPAYDDVVFNENARLTFNEDTPHLEINENDVPDDIHLKPDVEARNAKSDTSLESSDSDTMSLDKAETSSDSMDSNYSNTMAVDKAEASSDSEMQIADEESDKVFVESTVLTDINPERLVQANIAGKNFKQKDKLNILNTAPGEGKIPSGGFHNIPNWDRDAHPCLHPSGKYCKNSERPIALTNQQYIVQRCLNKCRQWAESATWVFNNCYEHERKQLSDQINISMQKGKVTDNPDGFTKTLHHLEDGHAVFQKIPGSGRYWLTMR